MLRSCWDFFQQKSEHTGWYYCVSKEIPLTLVILYLSNTKPNTTVAQRQPVRFLGKTNKMPPLQQILQYFYHCEDIWSSQRNKYTRTDSAGLQLKLKCAVCMWCLAALRHASLILVLVFSLWVVGMLFSDVCKHNRAVISQIQYTFLLSVVFQSVGSMCCSRQASCPAFYQLFIQILLYCTELYTTILHFIVLYCNLLYPIILYPTVLYYTLL